MVHAMVSGNVTDPILSTRAENQTGSTWIFGAFPDLEANRRPTFPIIVIDNPEADSSVDTFSTAGHQTKDIRTSVWAYSKGNEQLNVLTDAIKFAFTASGARLDFQGSGLQIRDVDAGAAGTDIMGNDRLHFREIQASMRLVA